MSRVGKSPVVVPASVQVNIKGSNVQVKGPKGEMKRDFSPNMDIRMEDGKVLVQRPSDEPMVRALHGTTRALIQNMVTGVSEGFVRVLEIDGVGYRAEMQGQNLVLHVGYSHPVTIEPETGISFDVETRTRQVKIMGIDKEKVGQVAADIREVRPPEPYKGKGIRYQGEHIRRKAGKSGTKGK